MRYHERVILLFEPKEKYDAKNSTTRLSFEKTRTVPAKISSFKYTDQMIAKGNYEAETLVVHIDARKQKHVDFLLIDDRLYKTVTHRRRRNVYIVQRSRREFQIERSGECE